ncbi:MAG TPA: nucleotidyltransferase family protein [Novosphingobium sp.]|nr:nucleotidyltransferase family protein [Novosphingobium sp.]
MNAILALLWGDPPAAAALADRLGEAEWRTIDRQAGQHRLRPLLHRRAGAGGWNAPAALIEEWQASYQRSALRALGQKAALARIGAALAGGGLSAAVLKGGVLVWSDGFDPALRPMRDLDLLVRPETAEAAAAALRQIGFTGGALPQAKGAKHLEPMVSGRVAVELHLHLFDSADEQAAARESQFIARAWQRAEPGTVPGLLELAPTDTLLHLILHAVIDHQFNNGPLLLGDMQALVGAGRIDWPLFWQEAAALEATRACQLALRIGQQVCALPVDWHGHEPADLSPAELDAALRLMLVDTGHRSAVGWPGQLLRLAPHRWPAQLAAMLARRRNRAAGEPGAGGGAGLGAAIGHAVGAEGRKSIADAVRLALWLRRG